MFAPVTRANLATPPQCSFLSLTNRKVELVLKFPRQRTKMPKLVREQLSSVVCRTRVPWPSNHLPKNSRCTVLKVWSSVQLQDCVDKAKKLIDDAIEKAKERTGNSCSLKVPHELIGIIIGRGGETIKDHAGETTFGSPKKPVSSWNLSREVMLQCTVHYSILKNR